MPTETTFPSLASDARTSRGRVHIDPYTDESAVYDVDRHRVLHSAAFRRLEYKTQVFVTHEHDHFRTRLTHTLEVAEIARQLAVALGLNSALAEVIALAHDLGHPPFGHAGETALAALMADHGGFEHNAQSLRVVDYLEHPYPPFRGLNLTFETREGLAKHSTTYDRPEDGLSGPVLNEFQGTGPWPTLEGQVASLADRLAYDSHDLEDALGAGLIGESDLMDVSLWRQASEPVRATYASEPLAAVRRPVLDRLAKLLLDDAVEESVRRLRGSHPTGIDDVRHAATSMIVLSKAMEDDVARLESFLLHRVYRHPRLVRMDFKARALIRRLFETYSANPGILPKRFAARIEDQGLPRVVCDYVAGMTDRYCQDEYKRLFEPFERV